MCVTSLHERDITAIGHVRQACPRESKKKKKNNYVCCPANHYSDHYCTSLVPLRRMSADHDRRYSTDRNFLGNSVDPDQILHHSPSDLGQHSFPGYPLNNGL